jgi:GNAT superfamily N-acetyltransferase
MPRALSPDGTAGCGCAAIFRFRATYVRGPAQVRIHARASRRRDRIQDNEHELYRESEIRIEGDLYMATELEFGLQTREELDEAGLIMARAYEDYDYVTLYFPDREKSRNGLPIFMQCVLKTCYGKADLLAAHRDGKLVARATLEAPGFKKPSAFQYIIHGFWRVYLNTKWSDINGFIAMDENASKPCHDFQKSGPDIWYLSMLEVDPSAQGQGVGSQFLIYMEEYVRERGGKQLALFTNSRENLAFYSKRGYEVFHECEIEHNGRKIGSWSMKKFLN